MRDLDERPDPFDVGAILAMREGKTEPAGQRTEYHSECECTCATPLPELVTDDADPKERQFACKNKGCNEPVNVDTLGKPYRRLPGDLDTEEQRKGRIVLEEAANADRYVREMIRELPAHEQQRLLAMPKRKFDRVAAQMLRTRARILEADAKYGPPKLGSNARRRAARRAAEQHVHKCEEEDGSENAGDRCVSRGFCRCACGATTPSMGDGEWEEAELALAEQTGTP